MHYMNALSNPFVQQEKDMSSLSIRGLDNDLSERLKKVASAEHKSVNQFVIDILKQHLGLTKNKRFTQCFHDLDQLFGVWNDESYESIQGKVDSERHIDDELWK